MLATRVQDYHPGLLDELCASGEVVWIGAGGIGAHDGRIALCFRDEARLLAPPAGERPDGSLVDALRAHLASAGASFWPELVRAAGTADERAVLAALWDLVWAGEVTNDGLAALRAVLGARPRAAQKGRPRPGRLTRVGPPAGAGRWSLVAPMLEPAPSPTEVMAARAQQLLTRHGIVTREAVRAEGIPAGSAAVYPALRTLEGGPAAPATSSPDSEARSALAQPSACASRSPTGPPAPCARGHRSGPAVRRRRPWPDLPTSTGGDDGTCACPDRRGVRARSWCSATAPVAFFDRGHTCSRSTSTTSTGSALPRGRAPGASDDSRSSANGVRALDSCRRRPRTPASSPPRGVVLRS